MPGICFYFESNDRDVYSGRQQDIDAWIYAIKIPCDIEKVIVVNSSDLTLRGLDMNFDWHIIGEMPILEGDVTNFVAPGRGGESMWNFDHQTDWYVFGPASGTIANTPDRTISIPQSNPNIHLHSVHVATTAMFHRYEVVK